MLLVNPPGNELLWLIVAIFPVQALREPVLHFIGVRDGGVAIEADEISKIVYSRDVAVSDFRLDGVLVLSPRFVLFRGSLEEAFQCGWAEFDSDLARVTGNGIRNHLARGIQRFAVSRGSKSCRSGCAEPRTEMQRKRDARRHFVAIDEVRGLEGQGGAVDHVGEG